MTSLVSLHNVIEEMELLTDGLRTYLNKVSGEIITITTEHIDAVESGVDLGDYSDWEQEALKELQMVLASADYLEFPSQFTRHEYEIMEKYCQSIEKATMRETLLDLIRGSGAFRRFRAAIARYGIEQDWHKFKAQAYKAIATEWLDSQGVDYTDDVGG
jgi:hypothetical protein